MPNQRRPRVVMLCINDQSSRAIASLLSAQTDLVAVLVENKVSGRRLLLRRAKNVGKLAAFGQLCFILLSRLTASFARKRVAEIYRNAGLDGTQFPPGTVNLVSSVNAEETRQVLREAAPDVVVVNGTRIIGANTLDCTPAPFLNTHLGITPRYRGVHGGYWALARQDPENFGATVHLLDTGIDTGAVLAQVRTQPEGEDSFHTYPALQLAAAAPILVESVLRAANGDLTDVPGLGPSELFYHPTLWHYLRTRLQTGVR